MLNNGKDSDGILNIYLYIYKNGELVAIETVDSPVENFGILFAGWLEMECSGGACADTKIAVTTIAGTTALNKQIYTFYDTTGWVNRYVFWAIDDATPPPFSRTMYSPKDADSTVYQLGDQTSGYYIDANGNLVVYIQSELYGFTSAVDIEAVALIWWLDRTNNADGAKVLLIYDILSTPISLNAGDNLQLEYRFVFP